MPQGWHRLRDRVEAWLHAERDRIPLWVPVAFGTGAGGWFLMPDPNQWIAAILAALAMACAAAAIGRGGRAAHSVAVGGILMAAGVATAWWRAEQVAAPVLARPVVAVVTGRVVGMEALVARDLVRLTIESDPGLGLPPRVRVNLSTADVPKGLGEEARIRLRARLMPPAAASVPGAYDFARAAWFAGIGATGRGIAPVELASPGMPEGSLRRRLTAHITDRLEGSRGGIAAALATGDEGAISERDAEAMRRAGLAHLLSVSGLHITAAVAATMFVTLRLLALWPWLAIRVRLPLVAAGLGALAAIGYTLLTGSQVPTIRSCVAALLVLAALAMGREAMTLRLVAAGAMVVLAVRPEALVGPSFQLSFAAIVAIVALHEHPRVRGWFEPREEARARRLVRGLGSLLLTGVVVETALMPIAVYHFHKAGLYGAAANIVAIPLTTFVVMPLEAGALVLDTVGLGGPLWWLTDGALCGLLWLAHVVADAPGASLAVPSMPLGAFLSMIAGGLWLALWSTRVRWVGVLPIVVGAVWAASTPPPDLLVTGDGRHMAIRVGGRLALLRDRAGDYTRAILAENGGTDGEPWLLDDLPEARCSRDACVAVLRDGGGQSFRVLATRSGYQLAWRDVVAACGRADVVVSDRRLPRACRPRWLRLDAPVLRRTGGVMLTLASGRVRTVTQPGDRHPWLVGAKVAPPRTDDILTAMPPR